MDGKRGWRVVIGAMLSLTITSGVAFFSFAAMLETIMRETGWSLSEVSLGVTLWGLASAIFSPFCGMLIDRFGARRMMTLGLPLGALTCWMTTQVHSLPLFYAVMVFSAFWCMSTTFLPVAAVVSRWFVKHRGTALGLSMLGIGLGGGLYPIITTELLGSVGWRATYIVLGLSLLIALIPTLLWIENPDPAEEVEYLKSLGESHTPQDSLTLGQAIRTRSFWGLSLGDMLAGLVFAIFNLQLIYYLTIEFGREDQATLVFSTLQLCLVFGMFLFGFLADKFKLQRVVVICYVLPMLGLLLLLPPASLPLAFAFALIAGLAGGGRSAIFPTALDDCFGETHIAAIYGLSNSLFMLGNAFGPSIASRIFEATESTRSVYGFCIVTVGVSTALVALIRREQDVA